MPGCTASCDPAPSDPTEKLLLEIPAGTGDQDLAGKYYYYFDNLPPRSGGVTFSYKVYAVFLGTDGSRTQSRPPIQPLPSRR